MTRSGTSSSPDTRLVETSSLELHVPDDYRLLSSAFKLLRYPLPDSMSFLDVHLILHEQLAAPYWVWWLDPRGRSVYVLLESDRMPTPLELGAEGKTHPEELGFKGVPFHIVVKLLMTDYFRGLRDVFTGQRKFYQYIMREDSRSVLCLQYDLRAAENVGQDDPEQTFDVLVEAKRFQAISPDYVKLAWNAYFVPQGSANILSFQMLNRREAEARLNSGESLWKPTGDRGNPARLDFFDLNSLETAWGYQLHDFCHHFSETLCKLGIPARPKQRHFVRYPAVGPAQASALDLDLNGAVFYVLDARHKKQIPLDYYVQRLQDWFPDCQFQEVSETELDNADSGAVIVIMDAEKGAYDGLMLDEDPYQRIYRANILTPLQGLNINPNSLDACGDAASYLSYGRWNSTELKQYEQRAQLVIRDAYLKHLILRQPQMLDCLPNVRTLSKYVFIYQGLHKSARYTVMLYLEDQVLRLEPVMDLDGHRRLRQVCGRFGVEWSSVEEAMTKRRTARFGDRFDPDKDYDFLVVVGRGLAAEILDVPEYALYSFEEILERVEERQTAKPLNYFCALPHFDTYAEAKGWPLTDEISEWGLENYSGLLSARQRDAITLLQHVRTHDEFVLALDRQRSTISYSELRNMESYQTLLIELFGTAKTRAISNILNSGGKLLSPRQADLLFYSGIWYDESDLTYMVGSPNSIQASQKNAHRLRRFEVLVGEHIELADMLELMAVGFVRVNQYTVIPYPFKLLRLYVENYLYWHLLETETG